MKGSFVLVRTRDRQWLLIKHRDEYATEEDIAETQPFSVLSKRTLAEIAEDEGGDVKKAATADPKKLIRGLGKTYEIMNTSIKRWAIGYPIQAPIDAVLNIIQKHRITAGDVEAVVITIDDQGARTVNQRTMASINIQHLTAVMLLDGDITFASAHDDKRVRDPRVLALKNRITLQGSAALGRARTTQAIVEITTRDGRRLRHHTKAVRGTAANPMPREEVAAKSRDLLLPIIGPRRTTRLIDAVWNIERLRDARTLRPLLAVK